jgi:DNA polymerase-3 subunit alpha
MCVPEARDFRAHEARVCIHEGRLLADQRREKRYSPEQYLKSPAEMNALFADLPEALENSFYIAQRCNLEMDFNRYHLPTFPTPDGIQVEDYLRKTAEQGLRNRLKNRPAADHHSRDEYAARLALELEVINGMGFPGYFLIVADFIRWARTNDIPVGPGRGSGADRWWPMPSASPISIQSSTACCLNDFSTLNAFPCRTSMSTSAWKSATR